MTVFDLPSVPPAHLARLLAAVSALCAVMACGGGGGGDDGEADVRQEPDCPDERPPHDPEFVRISAGTFTMGSSQRERGRGDNEEQHEVTLTRDYWIQTTEVTQRSYIELMGRLPFRSISAPRCQGDHPVGGTNWELAVAYANARSRAESLPPCYDEPSGAVIDGATPYDCRGYRLPTEAEWEYAARAGTTTSAWIGDLNGPWAGCEQGGGLLNNIAWYCITSDWALHPVASLDPNPWGLYDVLGNVAEWTSDIYAPYRGDVTDPTGGTVHPSTETRRVVRGGSSWDTWHKLRSASRTHVAPNSGDGGHGIRLVRTVH
jgi:sulfatase modifying factor 1